MHRGKLAALLGNRFDADADAARVVARSAGDLADAGTYREDAGVALTPDLVADELADAPDDTDVVERWNWWVGALAIAYGGYERFRVHRIESD